MKKQILLVGILTSVLLCFSSCSSSCLSTKIETTEGTIEGFEEDGVMKYLGIPYAKAPVGDLRFAPPQTPDYHSEVLSCKSFGHYAIQADKDSYRSTASEDCLYLNIWAPKNASNAPVYFFIHGGAYFNGTGSDVKYDGTNLAKEGIVTVTINYRLGALGFLALDTLMDIYGTTGNWGTLDQIKALKWVNNNIANFGGNAHNITIGGESAGSWSISNLLVSPLTDGLFQNCILESGSIFATSFVTPTTKGMMEESIDVGQWFCSEFGTTDSEEGLAYLRTLDAETLYNKAPFSSDIWNENEHFVWPVQDGFVLPKNLKTYLENNELKDVNILCGHNKDEGTMFNGSMKTKDDVTYYLSQIFDANTTDDIIAHYDSSSTDWFETGREIFKFGAFANGTRLLSNIYKNNGNNVYYYEDHYIQDPDSAYRCQHGLELPFVMRNLDAFFGAENVTQRDIDFMEKASSYWMNFMTNGDPNVGRSVEATWTPYSILDNKGMILDETCNFDTFYDIEDMNYLYDKLIMN